MIMRLFLYWQIMSLTLRVAFELDIMLGQLGRKQTSPLSSTFSTEVEGLEHRQYLDNLVLDSWSRKVQPHRFRARASSRADPNSLLALTCSACQAASFSYERFRQAVSEFRCGVATGDRYASTGGKFSNPSACTLPGILGMGCLQTSNPPAGEETHTSCTPIVAKTVPNDLVLTITRLPIRSMQIQVSHSP